MLARRIAVMVIAGVAATTLTPVQAAFAAGPDTGDPSADSVYCPPEEWYSNVGNQGPVIQGIGPTQGNYNGTGSSATSTFSAQVSGTVTATWSSSISVSGSVLVAGASAATGIGLSNSITASLGNTTAVTAPPGKTAFAQYGVYRLRTTGTYIKVYSNCSSTSAPTTAWSPWYAGWKTWVA